ncbi:MAG: agmatinase [Desulfococcaceae bacterium]
MSESTGEPTPPPFIHFGGDEVRPVPLSAARCAILPFCHESSPSYGTGSRFGPLHVLDASNQLEPLDEETLVPWADLPLHTTKPFFSSGPPESAVAEMTARVAEAMDAGATPVVLGGDHSVALGGMAAAADRYPDLAVLQLDAHLDLRDTWNGSPLNHACVMRRAVDDFGLRVVPVGVRSICREELDFLRRRDISPFFAHQILSRSDREWIDEVVSSLSERVYLSFDLDALDPAVLPGTGTPEPGGLGYRQAASLLRALGERRTVVGADFCELAPIPGTQVSQYTAARLVAKFLVYCL